MVGYGHREEEGLLEEGIFAEDGRYFFQDCGKEGAAELVFQVLFEEGE